MATIQLYWNDEHSQTNEGRRESEMQQTAEPPQTTTMQPPGAPPQYQRVERPVANTPSSLLSNRGPASATQAPTNPSTQTTTTSYYAPNRPPSPTPSNATSLPPYEDTSYKGFPSEAAYLAALKEWAEEKKYIQPGEEAQMLSGFYGTKTMDEYVGKQEKRRDGDKDEGKKDGMGRDGIGRLWRRMRRESEGQ